MKKLTALAFIAVAAASCTQKNVPVAETQTNQVELLAQGKTIYENSCKRCHDLPVPTDFTSVQWVGIMNSMAPKAKLTEDQHKLVYDYVVSVKK